MAAPKRSWHLLASESPEAIRKLEKIMVSDGTLNLKNTGTQVINGCMSCLWPVAMPTRTQRKKSCEDWTKGVLVTDNSNVFISSS